MRSLLLFTFLAIISVNAAAGDFFDDLSSIVVNLKKQGLSPEAEKAIAGAAGPLRVSAIAGDILRNVVERRCPAATDVYLSEVEKAFERLNPRVQMRRINPHDSILDAVLVSTTDILVPYCISQATQTRIVQTGDTIWRFYRESLADGGLQDFAEYAAAVARLNKTTPGKLKELGVGARILLPSSRVRIPVPQEAVSTVGRALREDVGPGSVESIQKGNWGTLDAPERGDDLSQTNACPQGEDARSLNFAELVFEKISNALIINDLADRIASWNRDTRSVRVAILDSGIDGGHLPLATSFSRKLKGLEEAEMRTLPQHDRRGHGTKVLFLSVGGKLFGRMNPFLRFVEVAPFRVIEEVFKRDASGNVVSSFGANPDWVMRGLRLASQKENGISIVNLSLRFSEDIEGFGDYVGSDQPFLIVASAGNAGEEFGRNNSAYPAMHGGNEGDNFITVAAVTEDSGWLESSNRSNTHVDIAAWGCHVPTLEYDASRDVYKTVFESGTSFAAPQVVFVAALLARENRDDSSILTPVQIKRRLVYSSDVHAGLWGFIKHGRVLNPEKALMVYTDIVELQDGRMLLGSLNFGNEPQHPVALCPDVVIPRGELRKIADMGPNFGAPNEPNGRYLIYSEPRKFEDADRRPFQVHWCNEISPNLTIRDLGGKEVPVDKGQLRDVVMAIGND